MPGLTFIIEHDDIKSHESMGLPAVSQLDPPLMQGTDEVLIGLRFKFLLCVARYESKGIQDQFIQLDRFSGKAIPSTMRICKIMWRRTDRKRNVSSLEVK